MLILNRKEGESIMIGDDIEIVVQEISGTHVLLGINAPKEVKVLREELVRRGNQTANSKDLDRKNPDGPPW